MALTDEQRSMLQLLLGGQSYDDIASLLGIPRDEVRARARAGLTEIGGADPDTEVAVSDYLLGQADPIGRADAVRHLQGDQGANALASRLVTQLRLLVPAAELPEIPAPRGGRRTGFGADTGTAGPSTVPGAGTPSAPAPSHPGSGVPPAPPTPPAGGRRRGPGGFLDGLSGERRTQLLVGLGALGLLLVIGVLAIAGVFGGGDDGDGGESASTTPTDEELTIVQLGPMEAGSEATGQAVFAQTQNQPVLQINLSNLPPAGEGQTYIVWLYNSDGAAFPIARDKVGENGNLTGAAPIPLQLVGLVGPNGFGCVDVSLADDNETQQALQAGLRGEDWPGHAGTSVLRGQIPSAPGEETPSGSESQCGASLPTPGQAGAQGQQGQGGGGQGGNGQGG